MLKNIAFLLCIASVPACGMVVYENPSGSSVQDQLAHIRAQMLSLKRSWNTERIHIKMAQKAAPQLYQTLTTTFDKILASDAFINKLDNAIASQVDTIVNKNMPFNSTTIAFNLSDFFPNVVMNDFGKNLFSAMAHKAYYLELGKRLASRMQELQLAVPTTTSTTTIMQ